MIAFACVALMAAVVVGCGSSSDGTSSGTQADAAQPELVTSTPPAKGDIDTVTWGLSYGEPTTVDPIMGLDYSPSFLSSQMCDTLLKRNEDQITEPNLASYTQVDDKTVVFDLRKDVKFWDGTPMTADDVVYSLERAAAPSSYLAYIFENVASIEKTGPYQVTVKLTRPDALFVDAMGSFSGAVVEKDFSEKAGKELGTPAGGIMCTGPFEFKKWTSGDSIELARNDEYWDKENQPHAEKLKFKFFSDSTALAQALISGEIDGAYEIPTSVVSRLSDASTGSVTVGPSRQYTDMLVRSIEGPLADPEVRRALSGVMDREGIARVIYAGTAEPRVTIVEPDTWDPEAKDQWEALEKEREQEVPMSVEEAKKLVEESDYDGTPIQLQTLAGDETQNKMGQIIQQSASEIGLKVEILPLQPTEYSEVGLDKTKKAGDLQFSTSWNSSPSPLGVIPWFVLKESPYNYTNYDNPKVEAKLKEAQNTLDPKRRNELLVEVTRAFEEENLIVPLVEPNEVMFMNNRVTGATPSIEYLFEPSMARVGASG